MQVHNNINHLDSYIIELMRKNPNRSLSAMFRNLRMKTPLIGDYPIMKHMMWVCKEHGFKFNSNQVYQACKSSKEYNESSGKEKIIWKKDLLDTYHSK